jgi:hypothetical protein
MRTKLGELRQPPAAIRLSAGRSQWSLVETARGTATLCRSPHLAQPAGAPPPHPPATTLPRIPCTSRPLKRQVLPGGIAHDSIIWPESATLRPLDRVARIMVKALRTERVSRRVNE